MKKEGSRFASCVKILKHKRTRLSSDKTTQHSSTTNNDSTFVDHELVLKDGRKTRGFYTQETLRILFPYLISI